MRQIIYEDKKRKTNESNGEGCLGKSGNGN